MKTKLMLTILLMAAMVRAYSRDPGAFTYQPYFSAVVVKNIDSSVKWYSALLGLRITKDIRDTQNGNHIMVLESANFLMELLQLKTSVDRTNFRAEIQGDFKFGFKVADMDACLKSLGQLKIDVPRVYTEESTKKRNFLIKDPDGNWIQFFE